MHAVFAGEGASVRALVPAVPDGGTRNARRVGARVPRSPCRYLDTGQNGSATRRSHGCVPVILSPYNILRDGVAASVSAVTLTRSPRLIRFRSGRHPYQRRALSPVITSCAAASTGYRHYRCRGCVPRRRRTGLCVTTSPLAAPRVESLCNRLTWCGASGNLGRRLCGGGGSGRGGRDGARTDRARVERARARARDWRRVCARSARDADRYVTPSRLRLVASMCHAGLESGLHATLY